MEALIGVGAGERVKRSGHHGTLRKALQVYLGLSAQLSNRSMPLRWGETWGNPIGFQGFKAKAILRVPPVVSGCVYVSAYV